MQFFVTALFKTNISAQLLIVDVSNQPTKLRVVSRSMTYFSSICDFVAEIFPLNCYFMFSARRRWVEVFKLSLFSLHFSGERT